MEHDFRSYMSTIIQPTIDRLGQYFGSIIILIVKMKVSTIQTN